MAAGFRAQSPTRSETPPVTRSPTRGGCSQWGTAAPLGGAQRSEGDPADSRARLGRASSEVEPGQDVSCVLRHGVCVPRRGRTYLVGPWGVAGPARACPHDHPARGDVALGFPSPSAPGCPLAGATARGARRRDRLPGAARSGRSFPRAKLEKSTSLYGDLGATTTFLFFMYVTSILIVSAPVLNSSLYDELLSRKRDEVKDEGATSRAERFTDAARPAEAAAFPPVSRRPGPRFDRRPCRPRAARAGRRPG